MSYILDALRKADAERERDPARGIHAQPAAGAAPRGARATGWLWPSLASLVLVAAAGLWWQGRAPAPARPVALPVPSTPSAPPAPAVAVVPVAAEVLPPAPPPLPAPAVERAAAKAAPMPVAPPQPAAAAPGVAAAPPPAQATATAAPAPAADRVYGISELPADVQRALPRLAISGGVHSENAAQRMLIVGGQVLAEGAEAAPGVVIEQIRARSAVLRFRGWRYSVGF